MSTRETTEHSVAGPGFFYGYVVVVAATFVMVITQGVFYSFGIFFKPILHEFGWTRAMTAGAFSLATVLRGLSAIIVGDLTDRFGPRLVVTLCSLFLGLGYLLMSQTTTIWQVYLFYGVLTGIGMSGPGVPLVATIPKWFISKRGVMTGIVFAGIGLGTFIIPPIANNLISGYDWRMSYLILGGSVLVLSSLATQFLRRDPAQVGQLALDNGIKDKDRLVNETKAFTLKEAVKFSQFWMVCAIYFCFGFPLFATMVHIAPHATDLGISTTDAANIIAIIGLVSIAGKVCIGFVIDRMGSRPAFIISFGTMTLSFLWLMVAKEPWMLYTFAIIFGFAYGTGITPQTTVIAELFGLSSLGLIMGIALFAFTIGAAIGPWLAGHIFDVFSNYQIAFLVLGGVSVLGIIATLLLKPLD